MIDIDIIIKGGSELSEMYPKEYERFVEELSEKVMDLFPVVGGCFTGSRLTDRHKAEEEAREKVRDQKFKTELIEILKEPEIQKKIQEIRAQVAVPAGN